MEGAALQNIRMLNRDLVEQFIAAALVSSIVNSVSGNDSESIYWRLNSFSFTTLYLWVEALRASTKQFDYENTTKSFSRFIISLVGAVIGFSNLCLTIFNIGVLYGKHYRSIGIVQAAIALFVRFASDKALPVQTWREECYDILNILGIQLNCTRIYRFVQVLIELRSINWLSILRVRGGGRARGPPIATSTTSATSQQERRGEESSYSNYRRRGDERRGASV